MNAGIRSVDVGGAQPYSIAIGDGLIDHGERLAAFVRGRHAVVVSDAHVAPLYARRLVAALQSQRPGLQVIVSCMQAGEAAKTLDNFAELMRELADFGATLDA